MPLGSGVLFDRQLRARFLKIVQFSNLYHLLYPQRLPQSHAARPGSVPSWLAHHAVDFSFSSTTSLLQARLKALPDSAPTSTRGRPASILVPIVELADGDAGLLFTRRSWSLSRHSGEISFPGGGVESGETYTQAALRETHEEIGVDPDTLHLIGSLGEGRTSSTSAPFQRVVGILKDPHNAQRSEEVDEVFIVALRSLARAEVFHFEIWNRGDSDDIEISFFELERDLLWGATARVVVELLTLLHGGPCS